MSGKEWYEKTTLANVAAAVVIVGTMIIAYRSNSLELITGVLIGGATTYLWRREDGNVS